jgi:hypothetical protein
MMDVYFPENIAGVLAALRQANHRATKLAQQFGVNPQIITIASIVYQGALEDVATAFRLQHDAAGVMTLPISEKVEYYE